LRNFICGLLLALLVVSLFTGAFYIQSAKAKASSPGETVQAADPVDWWPMFHHDPNHTGYSTSTGPTTNNTLWNYTAGLEVRSSPAVVGGFVYVGSWDDNVYCLNAATGTKVWSYKTGRDVVVSPAVAGGLVYVGSNDDNVYCLNAATGTKVWSYKTGGPVEYSSPAVVNGVVYVGSLDGNIYAFGPAFAALVVRGQDNRIYYRLYNATTSSWYGWNSLPTGTTMDSPAAAVCTNTLYVVVRGSDNTSLWFSSVNLTDSTFSGWALLSGSTPSAPTLTSNGTALTLVVRGQNNLIYYRFYDVASRTWSGWAALPSGATCDGSAAAILGNKLHVVVRGMDGHSIWHSSLDLSTAAFSGWDLVGGATESKPTLAACESRNEIILVVRGLNNVIYRNSWSGSSWTGWSSLPSGSTCDGIGATVIGRELHVVVRGMDGYSLWHSCVDLGTASFTGWTLLDGSTPSTPTLTS
jgi:hypothetical protein